MNWEKDLTCFPEAVKAGITNPIYAEIYSKADLFADMLYLSDSGFEFEFEDYYDSRIAEKKVLKSLVDMLTSYAKQGISEEYWLFIDHIGKRDLVLNALRKYRKEYSL